MAADWVAAGGTLLGVVVGAGTSLISEHRRERSNERRRLREVKEETYLAYLQAVVSCQRSLRHAYGQRALDPELATSLRMAFQDSNIFAAREKVRIYCSLPVLAKTEESFRAIRLYRDTLMTNPPHEKYLKVSDNASLANFNLRAAIRRELGLQSESQAEIEERVLAERQDNEGQE